VVAVANPCQLRAEIRCFCAKEVGVQLLFQPRDLGWRRATKALESDVVVGPELRVGEADVLPAIAPGGG
jgi:hypothetical protein